MTSMADMMAQDDFWDAMRHADWQERVAAIRLRVDEQQRWANRHNKPTVYGHDIYYREEE